MAKRRFGIIILLLCFCLCVLPCQALAASTTKAKEPISTEQACSLTITYSYDGTPFPSQEIALYKVADVSADFQYTLTAPFADTQLLLNGIQSHREWNMVRSTLEAHILANEIAPIATAVTDSTGATSFIQLTPGLYLSSALTVTQGDLTCAFDSALVSLPSLSAEGLWRYGVVIAAKPQILPPILQWKVVKLWKGDTGRTERPKSIQVEIFRNGESYETVTLSGENNWSYTWSAEADGTSWKAVEKHVPAGYKMTVEEQETTFIITNARQSRPDSPPKTGDSSNLLLYTTLLYVSGGLLILLGITGKRKRNEETN